MTADVQSSFKIQVRFCSVAKSVSSDLYIFVLKIASLGNTFLPRGYLLSKCKYDVWII